VPDIGGDEVEVTEIMVKVGDTVAAEQSLITVEGDKASMEVPAPFAGTVKEIKINTGDKVSTGSLIMIFEVAGAAPAAAPAQAAAPAAAAPAAAGGAKDVNVPDIGGDEVEVTEVMVKVGDKVAAEQSLITVEGDKASMEVPAPFAGTVKEIKISTGDKVSTGSLIMVFEVEGAAPAAAPAPRLLRHRLLHRLRLLNLPLHLLRKQKANLSSLKTTLTFTRPADSSPGARVRR
jgi:pyruvate dehydrogenase E2 component (dihydrolipoamide acetyltransferase)